MRSNYIDHIPFEIVKTADGALESIVDDAISSAAATYSEIDLRNKPFESILGLIVPGALWLSGHWMLAIFFGASQEFLGIGPNLIGKMIDSMLGFGENKEIPSEVSSLNLIGAARGVVDKILSGIAKESSLFRNNITVRGEMEMSDILAAWAAGPDKPAPAPKPAPASKAVPLPTIANPPKRRRSWFKWFRQVGGQKRFSIIAILYALLKLILAGAASKTGIKFVRKIVKERPSGPGVVTPRMPSLPERFREYVNSEGNVELSLIKTLDNAVRDNRGRPFSDFFHDLKGYSLRGSQEMSEIIDDVRVAHGSAPIHEINMYGYFSAPPVLEMAKRLLPQARYPKTSKAPRIPKAEIKKELESILGGK
jgi:hypothetical protein